MWGFCLCGVGWSSSWRRRRAGLEPEEAKYFPVVPFRAVRDAKTKCAKFFDPRVVLQRDLGELVAWDLGSLGRKEALYDSLPLGLSRRVYISDRGEAVLIGRY